MRAMLFGALFCLLSAGVGHSVLYRSNVVGMQFEEVEYEAREEHTYVLDIQTIDETVFERLYEDGVEIRRFEYRLDGREQVEYRDDTLRSHLLFDGVGRVVQEKSYDPEGNLLEQRDYRYDQGTILTVQSFDPEGEPLYREEQRYSSDGTLREVRRTFLQQQVSALSPDLPEPDDAAEPESDAGREDDEEQQASGLAPDLPEPEDAAEPEGDAGREDDEERQTSALAPDLPEPDDAAEPESDAGREDDVERKDSFSHYAYIGNKLFEESHAAGGQLFFIRYDDLRRAIYTEEKVDGEVLRVKRLEYGDDTEQRTPIGVTITEGDSFLEQQYDTGHRLLRQIAELQGTVVEQIDNGYDGDNLIFSETRSAEGMVRRDYRYSEEDGLQAERWFSDGELRREFLYGEGGARTETRYRNGQPFVRIHWEKETRIREEFLRSGQVIHVRELE